MIVTIIVKCFFVVQVIYLWLETGDEGLLLWQFTVFCNLYLILYVTKNSSIVIYYTCNFHVLHMTYSRLAQICLFSIFFKFYSKGDSSLTCTTNLWYCHATNIYFDLKSFNPDASNNRYINVVKGVKLSILLKICLKHESLYQSSSCPVLVLQLYFPADAGVRRAAGFHRGQNFFDELLSLYEKHASRWWNQVDKTVLGVDQFGFCLRTEIAQSWKKLPQTNVGLGWVLPGSSVHVLFF